MIHSTTPAQAGIREEALQRFMAAMKKNGVNLHSVLMARGDRLFFEKYWAPFNRDTIHRMYSVTKSFVSIAVGCLLDEGKIALSDPIIKYFPDKLPEKVHPFLAEQTIEDMLTMRTCFAEGKGWFQPHVQDRTAFYFSQTPAKIPGTLFYYDSTGSYILGVLVERVSGMGLLDYLKEKVLNHLGGFETAQLLKTPDGTPWGDSAMVCTPRALLNFARFVMNKGVWEGKRLLSESYLEKAISPMTDNNLTGSGHYNGHGYGYQIWRSEKNSFCFNGMGSQFAICMPDQDFIFVCTADTQLTSDRDSPVIFREVFDLAESEIEKKTELPDLDAPLSLSVARGKAHSDFEKCIQGKTFICDENPLGISWFKLLWNEKGGGCMVYENAQGEKQLSFCMKENCFGKFPQLGYSDEYGNVHEIRDFKYDCAASGGWVEEKKLQIRVQIIDRYFGILIINIGFKDENRCSMRMMKCAEDFLNEYNGWLNAEAE